MEKQTDDESDLSAHTVDALHAALAALTASGADCADPVRFRYIESLAARLEQSDTRVTQILLQKAWAALHPLQAEIDAQRTNSPALPQQKRQPETRSALATLIEQLDASGIDDDSGRPANTLDNRESDATIATASPPSSHAVQHENLARSTGGLRELKAAQFFRDTLQQQRADTLLSRAIVDAPEDSGPLNPQKLALRSLAIMGELSPAYLGHFVSYFDTLLWLENIDRARTSK